MAAAPALLYDWCHGAPSWDAAFSEEVSLKLRTLETRFRQATGRSLLQELTAARIDKARGLLASTRLSMKEIADLLGLVVLGRRMFPGN